MNNDPNPLVEQVQKISDSSEELIEQMRQTVAEPIPLSILPMPTIPLTNKVSFWELLRREKGFFWIIMGIIGWLVIASLLFIFYLNPRSSSSNLVLSEIAVTGPISLCPGEFLDFSFEMEVKEKGTYSLDMSVFKVSPPPAIAIFSERKFFVIGSPRTFKVIRHWEIPAEYIDEETSETIKFVAGSYERNIAVGTTSQDTLPSTRILSFFIRDDCVANN